MSEIIKHQAGRNSFVRRLSIKASETSKTSYNKVQREGAERLLILLLENPEQLEELTLLYQSVKEVE